MNEKTRPGVILYFDKFLPARELLSNEDLGALVNAVFDYVLSEALPQFDNPVLKMLFQMICPGLDSDGAKYAAKREMDSARGKYGAYCKPYKLRGEEPPLSFDEFKLTLEVSNGNSDLLEVSNGNSDLANKKENKEEKQDKKQEKKQIQQPAQEQEGEKEDSKGGKEGGLTMPRPLTEEEEQAARSGWIEKLKQYQ